MKNNVFTPLIFLLISVVLSTCNKQQAYIQNAGNLPPNYIIIQPGGSFSPATLRVSAGSSITFVNNDTRPRKIVSSNNSLVTGVIAPGSSFFFKNDKAMGTFTYQCILDPKNCGTIIITPR